MVKKLLPLFFLLFNVSLFGQIQKGDISIGGIAQISQIWSEDGFSDGFTAAIAPATAFMVSDRWLIGGAVGTVLSGQGIADNGFIQPEVRYYFSPTKTGNQYFASFVPSINLGDFDNSILNFGIGFSRLLNSSIALEGQGNYQVNGDNFNILLVGINFRSFLSKSDRKNGKVLSNFKKGNLTVGQNVAQLSYYRDVIQLSLSPTVGLFLSENFMVGSTLFANTIIQTDDSQNFNSNSIGLAPFVRNYFSKPAHWRWYVQGGASYDRTKISLEDFYEYTTEDFQINLAIGTEVFLTPVLAIGFSLQGFRSFPSDINLETERPDIFPTEPGRSILDNRSTGLVFNVGVNYFIER